MYIHIYSELFSAYQSSNFNSCPSRLCEGIGQALRKDECALCIYIRIINLCAKCSVWVIDMCTKSTFYSIRGCSKFIRIDGRCVCEPCFFYIRKQYVQFEVMRIRIQVQAGRHIDPGSEENIRKIFLNKCYGKSWEILRMTTKA